MHGAKSLLHSSIKLIRQSLGLWKPAKHNLISYCLYVIRERGNDKHFGVQAGEFFMLNVVGGYQDCGGRCCTAKVKLSLLPLFAFAYLFPMITPTHNNFLNSKKNYCKIQKYHQLFPETHNINKNLQLNVFV